MGMAEASCPKGEYSEPLALRARDIGALLPLPRALLLGDGQRRGVFILGSGQVSLMSPPTPIRWPKAQ
jgi:hypothetical protein